jgi:arylsulfatase A-like enzyme
MFTSPLPPEIHDTTYITDLGLGFMERHLDAHGGKPFFCTVSYVDPHDPYDPPEPYASMFDPADMPEALPAEWEADEIETLRRSQQRFHGFDKVFQRPELIRKLRALYHGSLRLIDDQVARLVRFLEDRGILDETIVVFTTDHGEMLGDHGLITKGVKHYDAGIRCPLVAAGGGVARGTTDRLTSTLDFFPTFCDWAEVDSGLRPPLEGRSFAPVVSGEADPDPWREVSVAVGGAASVVTDDRWRLTRFPEEGKGQMFDLSGDPDERANLYADPAHAAKRQELLERLVAVGARAHGIPQFRNMPVIDGAKHPIVADRLGDPVHFYRPPTPPRLM